MSTGKKVKVGVVGLGFGAEFVPLYQKHPDAECYAICQRDEANLDKYLDNPQGFLPGTKMAYLGLRNPAQRADVVAYLKTLKSQ